MTFFREPMTECLLVPMESQWTKKATLSLLTRAMTASKSSPLPVSLSPNSVWKARIPVNLIDPVEFASLQMEPSLLWILETTECKYSKNTLVLKVQFFLKKTKTRLIWMEKGYLMGVCYLETSTLKNQKNQLQEHSV